MAQPSRVIALLLGLLSVFSLSCESSGPVADPEDVHVVVVMPFTGSFRTRAERDRTAIQMAFRDLEAAGGVLPGRRIRAWEVDATDNVAECERRIRALIRDTLTHPTTGEPMVSAFISSTTLAFEGTLPVAVELHVPHIEISTGSHWDEYVLPSSYPELDANGFRELVSPIRATRPLCRAEAIMAADFMASRPEWRRVFLMRGTHTHDRLHTDVMRERFAQLADPDDPENPMRDSPWTGEIVNGADYVMEYGSDWSEHLRAAQASGADVMSYHLNGDSNNFDFLEQASLLDFSPNIVTCNMSEKPELLDPINPGIGDWLAGKLYFVGRRPVSSGLADRFRTDFEAYAGFAPDLWANSGYDAAMVIGLAIAAAGTTDPRAVNDAVPDVASGEMVVEYGQVSLALELLRAGRTVDYRGPSGPVDFREDGSSLGEFMVKETRWDPANRSGSFVTLAEPAPRQL